MEEIARQITSVILGISFIWIGIQHFRDPEWFEPIVPSILGNRNFWVYSSGIFEIILGMGSNDPKYSENLSFINVYNVIFLLYWANLNMWINDIPIGGSKLSQTGHLIRGLIQFILIIVFMDW